MTKASFGFVTISISQFFGRHPPTGVSCTEHPLITHHDNKGKLTGLMIQPSRDYSRPKGWGFLLL